MIRHLLGRTALAATLAWAASYAAHGQDTKPATPKPTDSKAADPKPSYVSPQTQKINELIQKGYEANGVKRSAARANDHEFLRRVFIDLIGRIATREEVIDFESDRSPDKRVKLVQRLMSSPEYQLRDEHRRPIPLGKGPSSTKYLTKNYAAEYAERWAEIWTIWLMTRSGHQDYRDQMRVWLEDQFLKNISHKEMVTKLLTATGQVGGAKTGEGWTPKPDYAANFIIHHLGEPIRDPQQRKLEGAFDAVPITSRVTRLFLGLQTQCTQCHDHPFNKEWVQTDFWGVNAFFRQTVRSATPSGAPIGNNPKMANAALVTLTDDPSLNGEMLVFYERRDGRRLGSFPVMLKDYAQAMNGEKSSKTLVSGSPGKTRREQLAEWVVAHDNFAKAYVNRIWAHFFGRGLNKEPSADDFGSNNDVVHPELLDYLAQEFIKYNYDPKRLMEWICTSDVYQLSHVAPKEYMDPKAEPTRLDPLFLRMPLKAMAPEVLFESLATATGADKRKSADAQARRNAWLGKLVRQFGDDEGNELSFNGTIVQALLMMNGAELNGALGVGRNADTTTVVDEVLKNNRGKSTKSIYDDLFLMTLNRRCTSEEIRKLEEVRLGKAAVNVGPAPAKGPPPKGPTPKGPAKGPKGPPSMVYAPPVAPNETPNFYKDVFWALLNTNEFMLNH